MSREAVKTMIPCPEVFSRRTNVLRSASILLSLAGPLALAVPAAAHAQEGADSAVFRVGLGLTHLKFVDRTPTTSTHQFAIMDIGVSKSFGAFFVGLDTELPFNQGGTTTNNELVQTESADVTGGYTFAGRWSLFGGAHFAKYDFWRDGALFTRHTDKGPYIGGGYGFSVGQAGQLSVSLAYGDFKSDIGAGPGKSKGNSASLTWSGDFRHGLQYYAKLRVLDYKFELDPDVVATGKRTVEKTITTLSAGIVF
jgi:hypothetical protein